MASERKLERAEYRIPVILKDIETDVSLKGIIVDMSGTGCGIVTNDRRVRLTEEANLVGRIFQLDFDFYDFETRGVEGKIVKIFAGADREHERDIGIQFTKIPLLLKRDINRTVMRDLEEQKRRGPAPPARRWNDE